ncbi:WG repeat-containing protein, partial [candidate division KSB1 bacterium]|nr:WG repeat-containing protein [candidate division KSB1 bacterium]
MFIPVELSAFSRWIFTNSLKASVLIFLILFIQWLVRDRLPSKWMYVLWLVLVIRLLLPAGFESGFSLYNFFKPFVMMKTAEIPAAKPESVSVYLTDSTPVAFNHRAEISPTGKSQPVHPLTKAWIAGAMTVALLAIAGNVRFWLRIKNRRPVKNPVWLLCMDECRKQMHIKQRVRLACSDAIRIPMLYGIFRPVILLPGAQNNKWTKDQLRHIFCHELAHLKRFDIPMACLTSVLQILHWFNPLLWIAFYRIRLVREMACDAIALNYLGREQARSYGATILAMLENISTESLLPMTVGIVESKRNLKKRMISIARFKQPRLVWTVLGLLVVLLTGGTVLTEARNHLAVGGAEVDDPAVLNETLSRNVRTSQTESTAVELNGPAKVTGIKKSHTHISGPIAANLSLTGDSAEVPGQKQHSATDVSPSALQKSFRQLEQSVSVEDKPQILRPISENGLYGYADSTGKVCIKPQFQMAMGFYENIAPVKKDGKWGYIDRKGNWVVNPELEAANQFGEGGLAEIKKEGKWGYINSGGEVSIEPQFENAYPFTEGLAVVQKNGKYGFIDAAGHVVVDFKYDRSNCFWNGLAAVDKNGKWGFIDSAGGLVIPCEYEKAEFFSEGLAAVQKNGRFGYIDVKNEFVIPLQFEAADHFSEGLAAVKPVGQKYGFIDKSGKIVIKPQYDVVLIPFEDGRAWVTIFENPEQGVEAQSLWIDPAGKVIESAGPKQKETKSGFHLQIKRNSIEFNGEKMGLKELRNILSVRYAEYVSRLKQPRDQKDIIGGGAVSVDIDDAVP